MHSKETGCTSCGSTTGVHTQGCFFNKTPEKRYEVIVGNIGSVYDGTDFAKAEKKFNTYVEQSKSNSGRAGGEMVTLMTDGEISREYNGPDDVPTGFKLTIKMGNDAMQTAHDVEYALKGVIQSLQHGCTDGGVILDKNGNNVGRYDFD